MLRPKIISRFSPSIIHGLLILAALVLLLAACASISSTLEHTEWRLISIRGNNPVGGHEITLEFMQEGMGGNAGCNSYGGKYTTTAEGALLFSDIVQTEMFCLGPEGIMEQEALYLKSLLEVASYRIIGNRLEFFSASGEVLLEFSH